MLTIVSKDTVMPILENILFTNNKMIVTNLEQWAEIPFEHNQTFVVTALYLKRIVDSLSPEDDINFSYNEETFEVKVLINDEPCYSIASDNPTDFPKMPSFNADQESYVFSFADDTRNVINEVLNFVSGDALRPAMNCVYISDQTAVATDGHRLAFRSISHVDFPAKQIKSHKNEEGVSWTLEPIEGMLITAKTFNIANKTKLDYQVSIAFVGEPQIHAESKLEHFTFPFYAKFQNKHFTMYSRCCDERFPDYKNVIPQLDKCNHFEVTVNTADLLKIIKQALVTANKTTHQLRFEMASIKANLLRVKSDDLDFGMSFSKEIVAKLTEHHIVKHIDVFNKETNQMESQPLAMLHLFDAIGMNGKLLLEILKWINPGNTVSFSMTVPNRAIMINYNTLLMPVMLNNYA